jgi:hypothetical protein
MIHLRAKDYEAGWKKYDEEKKRMQRQLHPVVI